MAARRRFRKQLFTVRDLGQDRKTELDMRPCSQLVGSPAPVKDEIWTRVRRLFKLIQDEKSEDRTLRFCRVHYEILNICYVKKMQNEEMF